MYHELLWPFSRLPDDYIVLDTETTGLPDENGLPDIVTLGITVVRGREIADSVEFETRPRRRISAGAQAIHGISDDKAAGFETFASQWHLMADYLQDQLVVIHNASFDWPILRHHVARDHLDMPAIEGVFCSQKAIIPWAQARQLRCSHRGPSLDTLTKEVGVEDLRAAKGGLHGARIDSLQAARVVEAVRGLACSFK